MNAQPNITHPDSAASSPAQHALPKAGAATVLPAVPSHAAPATFHLHFAADVWSMKLQHGGAKPEFTGSIYGKDSDGHGLTIDVKTDDLEALNRARRAICAMEGVQ